MEKMWDYDHKGVPIFVFLVSLGLGVWQFSTPTKTASVSSAPLAETHADSLASSMVARETMLDEKRGEKLLPAKEAVCQALNHYPRPPSAPMSSVNGDVSPLCRPFAGANRRRLDRCGDSQTDPYSSSMTESRSKFTWASRNELSKMGKINLFTDSNRKTERERFEKRIEHLKTSAREMCCSGEEACEREFDRVEVSLCRPASDPDAPDPCAFGGTFHYPGEGYAEIFARLREASSGSAFASQASAETKQDLQDMNRIALRNLSDVEFPRNPSMAGMSRPGTIVLSSYVTSRQGTAALEPILLHEFGHACSLAKMRRWATDPASDSKRALRAAVWLDHARLRCDREAELPEAYDDFWVSLGESKSLSSCLRDLAVQNQKGRLDRPCNGLCPGHYIEEAVGIAFSLLTGDLSAQAGSVFPNTCDHVRDGQHPMVSDVVDCLAQNSPRFRQRLKQAYRCS